MSHKVHRTIREILPEDLPRIRNDATGDERPANDQELLNVGIVHIDGNLYSCVHQEVRNEDSGAWCIVGECPPGQEVTRGFVKERHDNLPSDHRCRVLRARGHRDHAPGKNLDKAVRRLVRLRRLPAEEFESAVMTEARRASQDPHHSTIGSIEVPMADVAEGDVLEETEVIPHKWAGELER